LDLLGSATEFLRRELLGALAKAAGHVPGVETQCAPVEVDSAHDDVRVGMVSVVVIHRRPLDRAPDVLLDLVHLVPHVLSELELSGILGGHDEVELVRLAHTRLLKTAAATSPVGP
jgi:hypothetical protein